MTASEMRDFANPFYLRLFQMRVHGMNRRARDWGTEGRMTFDELAAVFDSCGWKCVECGSEQDLHADHIVPLKGGGENVAGNLRVLCEACNCTKGGQFGWERRKYWRDLGIEAQKGM
jgi:5-methylcytosine-specific restriction endonuclease McrA